MRTTEREEALETLQGMTKAEIIAWLAGEVGMLFRPPRKSQLLFARWKVAVDAAQARRERNVLPPELAKEMDRLTRELNANRDNVKVWLAIAAKLEPLHKQWNKWIEETKACTKEDAKVDAIYKAHEVQHQLEMKEKIRS